MRKIRLDKKVRMGLAIGLALTGVAIGGYQLQRGKSSRKRITFGVGLAAGISAALLWNEWRKNRSRSKVASRPVTQAIVPVSPADMPIGKPGDNMEERLDEAVHETFPASDPISVRIE